MIWLDSVVEGFPPANNIHPEKYSAINRSWDSITIIKKPHQLVTHHFIPQYIFLWDAFCIPIPCKSKYLAWCLGLPVTLLHPFSFLHYIHISQSYHHWFYLFLVYLTVLSVSSLDCIALNYGMNSIDRRLQSLKFFV